MISRPVFRAQYVVVAATVTPTAKDGLDIINIYDGIVTAALPTMVGLVVTARLIAEGDVGQHQYNYKVVWPNGDEREGPGGYRDLPMAVTAPGIATQRITMDINKIPISEYGLHRFVILVDGKEVGEAPFVVVHPRELPPQRGP